MTRDTTEHPVTGDETTAAEAEETALTLITYTSLAAWFQQLVVNARENQGLTVSPTSEYYVVSVLEGFADGDELFGLDDDGRRRDEALARILEAAVYAPGHDRIHHYRRLGDVALFVSGFFADSLRRRTVGVPYYVGMGQAAYGALSSMFRSGATASTFREVFEELADTFPAWVDVLREVSERSRISATPDEMDTSELVERLGRARGQRVSDLSMALLRRGVWPGA